MQNNKFFLSDSFDYLFNKFEDRLLVDTLARYLITDEKPITTPALWQDVVIFIRFKKRDVWTLSDEQYENAMRAIFTYRIKYIIEHLKKSEILEAFTKFYAQRNDGPFGHDNRPESPLHFFEQKLHAPIDSLFLTHEKLTIDKTKLKDLDKLFAYPSWLEFTDDAIDALFAKIEKNELTDEQIDYIFGATDGIKNYDKWFSVAKHALMTTNNPHTFWTAGDILATIRRAVPKDKKSQKWINDQIFEIFWPRVGSVWPLQNEDKLDFDFSDAGAILADSINWLRTLPDLKTRLPELKADFKLTDFDTDDKDFDFHSRTLLHELKNPSYDSKKALDLFFTLVDCTSNPELLTKLQAIAKDQLIPFIQNKNSDTKDNLSIIKRALKHAETYIADLAREGKTLARNLIK